MTINSILLIEDERINVLAVQKGLGKLDKENKLVAVDSAEKALDYLTESKNEMPQVILLDLNLPKMNGIGFLKVIKEHPELKKIPVIVLTTSESKQDRTTCFNLQVAGYFVKPIDYFELIRSIWGYWTKSEFARVDD